MAKWSDFGKLALLVGENLPGPSGEIIKRVRQGVSVSKRSDFDGAAASLRGELKAQLSGVAIKVFDEIALAWVMLAAEEHKAPKPKRRRRRKGATPKRKPQTP